MDGVAHHADGQPEECLGGDGDGEGVEFAAAIDEVHQGVGHHHKPRTHGEDEEEGATEGVTEGGLEADLIPLGGELGQLWEDDVGDGQHKNPCDDEVEVGGDLDGGHARTAVEVGAKVGVDGEVNGLYPGGHHDGEHQGKHLAHPLRPPLESQPLAVAQPVEGGELHHGLEEPAHQIGQCQPVDA